MPSKEHHYSLDIEWKGNTGSGTFDYRSYKRDHIISHPEKQHKITGSSDPAFRGDATAYNPEELFIASVANCHMLWYLHICAISEVVVTQYVDKPIGVLGEIDGSQKITEITLSPVITITSSSSADKAISLHKIAHDKCFIANSINVPITIHPTIQVE